MQNALRERQQERLVQREQKQKDKEKRHKRHQAGPSEEEEDEEEGGLDLLPDTVLDTLTRTRDNDDGDDQEDEDRRVVERRIVSEQLRHGIMQGKKKKKFQDKTIGPVRVTTLTAHSYASAAGMYALFSSLMIHYHQPLIFFCSIGCQEAKAFLERKLGQRHKRSFSTNSTTASMAMGGKRQRQSSFTYF
jgi:hypothetical protein